MEMCTHLLIELQTSVKQNRMNNVFFVNSTEFKTLGSVTKQIRLINNFLHTNLFKFKYPKVSRGNVVAAPIVVGERLFFNHRGVSVSAVKFSHLPKIRQLPCYGNLEMPHRMKQDRSTILNRNCVRNRKRHAEVQCGVKVEGSVVKVEAVKTETVKMESLKVEGVKREVGVMTEIKMEKMEEDDFIPSKEIARATEEELVKRGEIYNCI